MASCGSYSGHSRVKVLVIVVTAVVAVTWQWCWRKFGGGGVTGGPGGPGSFGILVGVIPCHQKQL